MRSTEQDHTGGRAQRRPSGVRAGRTGSRDLRKYGSLHTGGRQEFGLGKEPSRQKRKIMKKTRGEKEQGL